jgi:ABC-type molybdate transport system substrate-binding protein
MRKIWMIVLMGLLVTGCGTGNQVSNNDQDQGGAGIVAGEMAASLTEEKPLIFQYEVKNQTEEEVTLEFTSSQRYDYSVKTKDGKDVFLFSSVASFLQALGEEKVKQGEALKYEIDLHELSLEKGDYVLSVWMTPKGGKKYEIKKEFSVE